MVPDVTGLLVPPGDAGALTRAIERVLDDPARASTLGRAGRDRVAARFTWDSIADTLASYYESVSWASADRVQILTSHVPLGGGNRAVHAAP